LGCSEQMMLNAGPDNDDSYPDSQNLETKPWWPQSIEAMQNCGSPRTLKSPAMW
jgi:hypothetical protein